MMQWLSKNGKTIWYTICFALLGLIDQRCGSAIGEVQMIFSNCTGLVIAFMLLPSLQLYKFKEKIYFLWTPVCLVLTVIACVVGSKYWAYTGQWITGVLNLTVWSYLVIYMVREWKSFDGLKRLRRPFFLCMLLAWICMLLSVRGEIAPLWYILIFGGFYLLGIKQENRPCFFQGMLNGMIVWFFVQQIIAFGFRPYDYARYRGLYSGETQNGLFYMMVYCAFLLKWWLAEEKKANRLWRLFYFVMAAGCVGFMILTGGRTALVGAVIITLLLYTYYFIFQKKSFWSWLLKGIALVLCIVVMFPAVYGCVRYLPTILHHPVWFEGEYNADTSVHSYDPWNSERYITFEKVLELNAGRLLQLFGIDLKELQAKKNSSVGAMKVEAAETAKPTSIAEPASTAQPTATPKPVETAMPEVTPTPVVTPTAKPVVELGSGETPEDPYIKENFPSYNSVKIRRILYRYYITHLNWQGHTYDDGGFYIEAYTYMHHAHNMFLQMAFDYGILPGILFLGICLYSLWGFVKRQRTEDVIAAIMLIAIICFGMFEMVVESGQITLTLLWILFCLAGENSFVLKKKQNKLI